MKWYQVSIPRKSIYQKYFHGFQVMKNKVKIEKMVQQSANLGSFISSLYSEDYDLMSRSVVDIVVEPNRRMLIPEFDKIKNISMSNGAIAVGISGSGPSIFLKWHWCVYDFKGDSSAFNLSQTIRYPKIYLDLARKST